jgi:hypothetical protein
MVGDSLLGVLSLYSTLLDAFSEDHERLLEGVAKQISPAMEQAIISQRTNPVHPQRAALVGAKQLDPPSITSNLTIVMSLLYIDVSWLGEADGAERLVFVEQALACLLSCVRGHSRTDDVLLRYDNDDFIVLQPHTDRFTAEELAGRLRLAIDRELANRNLTAVLRVGLGLSSLPEDGQSVQALVLAAQQRAVEVGSAQEGKANSHRGSIH